MTTYSYQAWGKSGYRVTKDTPKQAAEAFFTANPTARKCNVTEGTVDGAFFTVVYGVGRTLRWTDVTKKLAAALPDVTREKV